MKMHAAMFFFAAIVAWGCNKNSPPSATATEAPATPDPVEEESDEAYLGGSGPAGFHNAPVPEESEPVEEAWGNDEQVEDGENDFEEDEEYDEEYYQEEDYELEDEGFET